MSIFAIIEAGDFKFYAQLRVREVLLKQFLYQNWQEGCIATVQSDDFNFDTKLGFT